MHNSSIVTRYVGSGIRRVGSQPQDQDHKPWDRGQQFFELGIKDQVVPFLWDQGPKFVTIKDEKFGYINGMRYHNQFRMILRTQNHFFLDRRKPST